MTWDGYRLCGQIFEPGAVRILTRSGRDGTHRVPSLADLTAGTAILDGEAVVLDDQGRSSFASLQRALGGRGGKCVAATVHFFYAFNYLYLDGRPASHRSYEASEAALGRLGRPLLAAYRGDRLVHVGGVGTGFTASKARRSEGSSTRSGRTSQLYRSAAKASSGRSRRSSTRLSSGLDRRGNAEAPVVQGGAGRR